jgi:hypothetical protein
VRSGDQTTDEIVARLYPDLIDELVIRAKQTVHSHLRKLAAEGQVETKDLDDEDGAWSAIS